jgi:VanZ family protein
VTVKQLFHSRRATWVALAVVLLIIIGLSLDPRPESVLGPLSVYDKVEHFAGYFVLAFFVLRVFPRRGLLFPIIAVAACAALGGAIEIIQPYVGRHKDILDFCVDLGGSAAGAAVSWLLARRWPVRRRQAPPG